MYVQFLAIFLAFQLLLVESNADGTGNCSAGNPWIIGRVGGVIKQHSRVGQEQKLAMEMAVQDIYNLSSCFKLDLHFKDSNGSSTRAASAVMELVEENQVQATIGTFTGQEADLLYGFDKLTKEIPIISITPTAEFLPPWPLKPPTFIQMNNDIVNHLQCVAAIIGYYRWQRVTAIYEHSNSFGTDSGLITRLSDLLRLVDSSIDQHLAFPPMPSLATPEVIIQERLEKLKTSNNRVFIVLQSSLQFSVLLFEKAKQMGLMEKDCVWIISDDIASLIDSFGPSVISNMQGFIGFRTYYQSTTKAYKEFKLKFQRTYRSAYPDEEGHSNPSIYALRTYDATWALANGIQGSMGKNASKTLLESILASNFEGLSGKINFNSGRLAELPIFTIINVVGRSYREIALWSQESGFFNNNVNEHGQMERRNNSRLTVDLDSNYWPGGLQGVPKGWTLSENEKPLKVGVPARGAFNQFVKVSYDQENKTHVSGFSIDVFEAAVKWLPYHLPFIFVPFNGTYDEMVAEVHNKSLDAAVGDTDILADRYEFAEFSQPYIESGLVMVVRVKPNAPERFMFMKAFKLEMWAVMAAMSISTGFVVWLTEHAENNPDFQGSVSHKVGRMLWFSVNVLSFSQRETIKSNLSRFVLAMWLFVVVIVAACFTAVLTSMMTVRQLQPNIIDIEHLQKTNAGVGCNGNSFILAYLKNVLHFHPDNIKKIYSIKDYPEAFEKRDIDAAFFVVPHAKVFLAEYCQGYTMAGPRFKLGGFGFVLQKGSPLVSDLSEAILKVTQTGEINQLERQMLSLANCSTSTSLPNVPSLGPEPFSGLFIVSGCVSAVALLITVIRILQKHSSFLNLVRENLTQTRIGRWASMILIQIHATSNFRLRGGRISSVIDNQTDMCEEMQQKTVGIELGPNEAAKILQVQGRIIYVHGCPDC